MPGSYQYCQLRGGLMKNKIWKSDSFRRTGLRHQNKSQPCQDYILTAKIGKNSESDDLFILCDGISSCAKAENGSEVSAVTVRDYFIKKASERDYVTRLLASPKAEMNLIRVELFENIKRRLADYPDADTTLTFVWLINSRFALTGCLGDSAVCIFSENKSLVLTQTNDYGGATESVRNSRATELIDLRLIDMKVDKVNGFLLTSDGLESVLYTKGKRTRSLHLCQDCVNTLFEEDGHKQVERFLDEVCADGSFDDDISLIIAACEPIALPEDPTWMCTCGSHNPLLSPRCEKCGNDYFSLYGKVDMSGYPSAWEYFQYLNSHPEEECMIVKPNKNNQSKHAENEHVIYLDDIKSYGDQDYDVVGFVEYHGRRGEHSFKPDSETLNDQVHRPLEESHRTASQDRHLTHAHRRTALLIPKRIALVGSIVTVLLCGILVVNFFQMLSISNSLREMRTEIDSLKEERQERITINKTTSSVSETTAVILPTEIVSTEEPTQTVTEPESEMKLSVNEVVSVYPDHNYLQDALADCLTPESAVIEIRRETVNGVVWVQVKSEKGIIGWAPYEYFTPIVDSNDLNQPTDVPEQIE